VEKLRSAREGALRISRNFDSLLPSLGGGSDQARGIVRGLVFSWGEAVIAFPTRERSDLNLVGLCGESHRGSGYRFAWRRLIVRFLPASPARVFRAWRAAEGFLPADSAAVAPARGNAGRRIRILSAAEAGLRAGGAAISLAAWSRGNSIRSAGTRMFFVLLRLKSAGRAAARPLTRP
jgi:hypothetical protein